MIIARIEGMPSILIKTLEDFLFDIVQLNYERKFTGKKKIKPNRLINYSRILIK